MNISELNQKTVQELKLIAKELNLSGCRKMKKSDLVQLIFEKTQKASKSVDAKKSTRAPSSSQKSGSKKSQSQPRTLFDSCEEKPRAQDRPGKKDAKKASKEIAPENAAESSKEKRSTPSEKTKKSEKEAKPATDSNADSTDSGKEPELSVPQPLSAPVRREPPVEPGATQKKVKDSFNKARDISGIYEEINGVNRDRFVLLVRDPYWLHVYWELCTRLIERAKAAMGHSWHTAVPVLRLFQIVADGVNNPRRDHLRDIRIHGGVNNWYIDVQNPPGTFQVEIGFLSREGNFFPISSTNIVQTPQSQVISGTNLDGHWESISEDFDRIYKLSGGTSDNNGQLKAVFEEQLQRSMSMPLISRFGAKSLALERTKRHFQFDVDADVILHGKTDPSVQVSIKGEPIQVENNGTFSVRYTLAEKRQVFPIEAKGSDGIETQQVIIAIDRNTKVLETVFLDNDDDD